MEGASGPKSVNGDALPTNSRRAADTFSALPATAASGSDAHLCRRKVRRAAAAPLADPRHRSVADPERPRGTPLPLPAAEDRPLLSRLVAPLSAAEAADVFARGGLRALAWLTRARLAVAVAEKRVGPFLWGNIVVQLTCIPLLAAIGLARDPEEPSGPFALACVGILLGHVAAYGIFTGVQHRIIIAPNFTSPADPELVGDDASTLAVYWARGGADPEQYSLLQHQPSSSDFGPLEQLYKPSAGAGDPEPGSAPASPVFQRSDSCPCSRCLGFFSGGGWTVVLRFLANHLLVTGGIEAAIMALCFWDLWRSPGGASPLYTQPWVATCVALYAISGFACVVAAPARRAGVMHWIGSRVVTVVQARAARVACGEFVGACADLVRSVVAASPVAADSFTWTEASGSYPLPELYARVASDVREHVQQSVASATYVHFPLAGTAVCVFGALLCSLPAGGSCYPAWGLALPLFGLHVSVLMLAIVALVNAGAAAVSQTYREAADALSSLLADLQSRRLVPRPSPHAPELAAFLAAHRDVMDRIASGMPRARFLGFVVTGASLANLTVAVVTVCATLFRAFGLRLQLGTYCTPAVV